MLGGPDAFAPAYADIAANQPYLAIGPIWQDDQGHPRGLADFEEEIKRAALEIIEQSETKVHFRVIYTGDFTECNIITENYVLSPQGLDYTVEFDRPPKNLRLTVPLIQNDGGGESEISQDKTGFNVRYRNAIYSVTGPAAGSLENQTAVNRNAIYRIGIIQGRSVKLTLAQDVIPKVNNSL